MRLLKSLILQMVVVQTLISRLIYRTSILSLVIAEKSLPTLPNGLFQVISDAFEGKRPVNRQRMVNKAIKQYTPDIHALRVTALTNSEAENS